MRQFFPTHPQAALAIYLAQKLRGAYPPHITNMLRITGVPRKLFVLASALEAEDCIGHFVNTTA